MFYIVRTYSRLLNHSQSYKSKWAFLFKYASLVTEMVGKERPYKRDQWLHANFLVFSSPLIVDMATTDVELF